MQPSPDPRVPYHRSLRAVGAWLDREPHTRFRVIETLTGFTVILELLEDGRKRAEHVFTFAELVEADTVLEAQRLSKEGVDEPDVFVGHWSFVATSHQDFLRALGYELDAADAAAVMLDELEDSLVLTFSHLAQGGSYVWHKRMVVLTGEQAEQILAVARSRRKAVAKQTFLDYITRLF